LRLIRKHQHEMVELGAPAQMLAAGDLEEVLPPEEVETLDAAKPVQGGFVKFDPVKLRAREEAMVRTVLHADLPVALIVLGGDHDLSASSRELAPRASYFRVTTKRYREMAK
jgi:hypothetical protein